MIEVGEYVRTKNDGIKRIDTIFEYKAVDKYGYESGGDWDGKWYSYIKTTDIINHSKDIKDLIEIGDYINGCKVVEFFRDKLTGLAVIKTANQRKYYSSKIIKSIVTKEQFKNAEYRIPEEK